MTSYPREVVRAAQVWRLAYIEGREQDEDDELFMDILFESGVLQSDDMINEIEVIPGGVRVTIGVACFDIATT